MIVQKLLLLLQETRWQNLAVLGQEDSFFPSQLAAFRIKLFTLMTLGFRKLLLRIRLFKKLIGIFLIVFPLQMNITFNLRMVPGRHLRILLALPKILFDVISRHLF